MSAFIRNKLPEIILSIFVVAYSIYFSLLTVHRYEKLYAHYFDLGIMHQTVYNTYKGLQTGDFSRILELTSPHDSASQVKRMAVHNDMLLALLAPFYFIHSGPETILIIQTIGVAMGAVFLYLIAAIILKKIPYSAWIGLSLSMAYLLYPPQQNANKFEFHAVTLATTLLLGMYYFWLQKKYIKSIIFLILSILTKEQVGMTTALFGGYVLFNTYKASNPVWLTWKPIQDFSRNLITNIKSNMEIRFGVITICVSIFWILVSMLIIIPAARGGEHFASKYYDHLKEHPIWLITYPIRFSTIEYFTKLLGPVGFLSLLSPLHLLIAVPEFAINLYSNNDNMRNTYFHYNSIIIPFIFISSIYGIQFLYQFIQDRFKLTSLGRISSFICGYILISAFLFSYLHSPLPYAKHADTVPFRAPPKKYVDVMLWKKMLEDDQTKVSTTGHMAPHFTSRQYFYDFSWKYKYAEYVIIDEHEVIYGFSKAETVPAYAMLQNDRKYIKLYDENGIEVYKKYDIGNNSLP